MSRADPAKYRPKDELQHMRETRDPIENFGKKLLAQGVASEDDLKMMDKEIKQVVVEAAEFATTSPEPGVDELYTDILA